MATSRAPLIGQQPPQRSWRAAPAWVMLGLIALESLLLASERFQWFSFSAGKGWSVLTCLAVVGAALLAAALWLAVLRISRWPFQFDIRALLLLTVVVAIASGWMASELRRAKQQQWLVAAATKEGCGLLFDYNLTESGQPQMFSGERPGKTILHSWLGEDFFRKIVGASPKSDAALALLKDEWAIRRLMANDSQVTDEGLKHLARMSRLEWLDLRDAPQVTSAGLGPLKEHSGLEALLIRRTGVGDEGLSYLVNAKELEVLDLGMTPVTDKGLEHLAGLTQLRQLSFWGNRIEDAGLTHLRGMTRLELLDLGGAPVTDEGLANLKGLNRLQSLGLRGSRITDGGLAHLSDLRELRQLDLFNTKVTDAGIEHLKHLAHLETLNVGETGVSDAGIQKLGRLLPRCQVVR